MESIHRIKGKETKQGDFIITIDPCSVRGLIKTKYLFNRVDKLVIGGDQIFYISENGKTRLLVPIDIIVNCFFTYDMDLINRGINISECFNSLRFHMYPDLDMWLSRDYEPHLKDKIKDCLQSTTNLLHLKNLVARPSYLISYKIKYSDKVWLLTLKYDIKGYLPRGTAPLFWLRCNNIAHDMLLRRKHDYRTVRKCISACVLSNNIQGLYVIDGIGLNLRGYHVKGVNQMHKAMYAPLFEVQDLIPDIANNIYKYL